MSVRASVVPLSSQSNGALIAFDPPSPLASPLSGLLLQENTFEDTGSSMAPNLPVLDRYCYCQLPCSTPDWDRGFEPIKGGGKSKKVVCLIPAEWLWSAVRDPKVPRNLGVKEVDKRIVACDLSPGHCALGPGDDFWHLTGRSLRSSADAMELSEDSVVPRVLAATTLASVLAFYRRSCDPAGPYCLPT